VRVERKVLDKLFRLKLLRKKIFKKGVLLEIEIETRSVFICPEFSENISFPGLAGAFEQ